MQKRQKKNLAGKRAIKSGMELLKSSIEASV